MHSTRKLLQRTLVIGAGMLCCASVLAQPNADSQGPVNWKLPTLGGTQFWTDIEVTSGWRIQVNSETGHARLLDANNVRHAWGRAAHCRARLNQAKAEGVVRPAKGKVVILLHGLIRTSGSMQPMQEFLEKQGYATINFRYASTRATVAEHAKSLKSVVDRLEPEVHEIYFVAHSLGNLVIRRYLADSTDETTGRQGDSRIKRVVMLGPPNQGSKMARMLKSSLMFNTIAGKSGQQLASGWKKLNPTLATPSVDFGIIAGGQENEYLSNFVLKGKDDFTVSLEETKLPGAADLMVKPLLHSTMMRQPEVMQATVKFFRHGYFDTAETRSPIPRR